MSISVRRAAIAAIVLAGGVLAAAQLPAFAQNFRFDGRSLSFRFDNDERGNVEGKRASCEVYAKIAVVQAEANDKFRCGMGGPRWGRDPEPHFRWCRFVRRPTLVSELRARADDLQRCFDRLGDFDDDRYERR